MTNSNRRTATWKGLAIASAALVTAAFAAPLDAAERSRSTSTRSGSVSSSGTATRSSSGASSSRSSGGAAVTRSSRGSSGGTATRGARSGSSSRRHYRHYYDYGHRYGYWGAYFGLYPWAYWGHSYYSYYPIFPAIYYGPYAGGYRDYGLGAVDLNVKPKKTEVWVDGELVGFSGKFDGFPGYLWLGKGRHQLIFHNPGFATEVRDVRVLEGTVVRLNLRLEPGESVAPETLARKDVGRRQRPQRERRPAPVVRDEAPPKEQRTVRIEPGRLSLSIQPGDASVYLDGRFLGTADELSRLHAGLLVEAGPHTLEVVRPGFRAERMELLIEAEIESEISIELESG